MMILDDWFKANKLSLNISKTKYIIFHPVNRVLPAVEWDIKIGTAKITRRTTLKFLVYSWMKT